MRIAILDDYLGVSQSLADWSGAGEVTVFRERIPEEALAETLQPFDIVCSMRERTAFPRDLLERLPNLKLLTITGGKHRTLDMEAATARGIVVSGTSRRGTGHHATPELAWGLILSLARHIPEEVAKMRSGGWQTTLGTVLSGKTLGLIGLGRLGSRMVPIGRAFEMEVLAWSQNLTEEHAASLGAARVEKDELLARADVVSLHVVLSERTRGIIGAREFALMKPSALLVNTARAQLVDRAALIAALRTGRIAGAALDVFDVEPLPNDDELRALPNAILTPHLGYTVEDLLRVFYEDTVENVLAFRRGEPVRVLNPEVLGR